jgi:hypothetical protein
MNTIPILTRQNASLSISKEKKKSNIQSNQTVQIVETVPVINIPVHLRLAPSSTML